MKYGGFCAGIAYFVLWSGRDVLAEVIHADQDAQHAGLQIDGIWRTSRVSVSGQCGANDQDLSGIVRQACGQLFHPQDRRVLAGGLLRRVKNRA